MEKVFYGNWLFAVQEWLEIISKIRTKKFPVGSDVFRWHFPITQLCGFVECEQCFLFSRKVKDVFVCYHDMRRETHFSILIDEMRKESPNFEIALAECQIIFGAILEDCPDKDRAIKDGIVFG